MTEHEGCDCDSAQVRPFSIWLCLFHIPAPGQKAKGATVPIFRRVIFLPERPTTPQWGQTPTGAGWLVFLHGQQAEAGSHPSVPIAGKDPVEVGWSQKGRRFSRSVCDSHSGIDRSGACC